MQLASVRKSCARNPGVVPPPCFHCRQCCFKAECDMCDPSTYEAAFYRQLLGAPDLGPCLAEHRVLGCGYGAVDVYLEAYGLGIMIDGEHHHPAVCKGHHATRASKQACIDMIFNLAVLAHANTSSMRGVVRLHFRDEGLWMATIRDALKLLQDSRVQAFVMFSPSYRPNTTMMLPLQLTMYSS